MSCQLGEDVPCGIYCFIDDIKDLKIRIHIQKAGLPCLQNAEGSDTLHQTTSSKETNSTSADQIFSWQEKISKLEEKEISSSSMCVSNNDGTNQNGLQLFTYIDSEIRTEYKNSKVLCSETSKDSVSRKAGRMAYSSKTCQKSFILNEKDIVQISKSKKRFGLPTQLMAIMAVLDKDDKSDDCEEVQLCLITSYTSGILIITPDFNTSKYYIQNRSLENFEYIIQNASKDMNRMDAEKERKFMKQLALQHDKVIHEAVGEHFDMPDSDMALLLLNGEIVSAQEYDCKYAFVRYNFQVGNGFLVESDQLLCGTTHTCRLKTKNVTTIANYSCPFNFVIPIDFHSLKKDVGVMPKLTLKIEVISVDYWGIFRNEGYGFCIVNLSPGSNIYHVSTWKLLPQGIHEALQNYFLGGTPSLKDTDFITAPDNLQGACLGKLGTKTENSGSVTVKMDVITHFGCEASSHNLVH